jgi:hypothetical protein
MAERFIAQYVNTSARYVVLARPIPRSLPSFQPSIRVLFRFRYGGKSFAAIDRFPNMAKRTQVVNVLCSLAAVYSQYYVSLPHLAHSIWDIYRFLQNVYFVSLVLPFTNRGFLPGTHKPLCQIALAGPDQRGNDFLLLCTVHLVAPTSVF